MEAQIMFANLCDIEEWMAFVDTVFLKMADYITPIG
jgi:hypothetical protein